MDVKKLNLNVFEFLVDGGISTKNFRLRGFCLQTAAKIATHIPLGIYSSKQLDGALESFSSSLFPYINGSIATKPPGALHVVSETYETGGHTKVIESFIDSSSSDTTPIVFFTRKSKPSRAMLEMSLEGRIKIIFSKGSLIARSARLREVALQASEVTLHTHMDDVVPSLALGANFPKERISRFNHADHRFWVGANLATLNLETRTWGSKLSQELRSIHRSKVIGIPGSLVGNCGCSRLPDSMLRERLGITNTGVVLLTVGNDSKYQPIEGQDFVDSAIAILQKRKDAFLVSIGGSRKINKKWAKLKKNYPSRVLIFPRVERHDLPHFYHEADIGLDSFPMSGGTVLQEMRFHGLPVVVRECSTGHLDFTYWSSSYTKSQEQWIEETLARIDFYLAKNDPVEARSSRDVRFERRRILYQREESNLNCELSPGWEPKINLIDLDRYLNASMNRKAKLLRAALAIIGCAIRYLPTSKRDDNA